MIMIMRRHLVFSVAGLAFFLAVSHRSAPIIAADQIMREFAITSTVFGYLVATYFFIYAAMQVPSGVLADYLGPRATVTAGTVLAGFGSVLLGQSGNLQELFLSRFLIGLGCSVIFISTLRLVACWYSAREFATLSGVITIIGSFGAMAATYPLARLVERCGWRVSFELIGLGSFFVAVLSWLLIRNRPLEADLSSGGTSSGEAATAGMEISRALKLTLTNRYTWPPFFAMMLTFGPTAAFTGVISMPYLMQVHALPREQAASILLALTVGSTISAPLVGYLSDKVLKKRKRPYLVLSALYFCTWLVFLLWGGSKPPREALYGLLFVMGFSSNSIVLAWSCAKEVNHPAVTGIATGTVNGGGMMGVAFLQPLSGHLLDRGWQGTLQNGVPLYPLSAFRAVFSLFALAAALGLLAAAFIKETYASNIYHTIASGPTRNHLRSEVTWRK